MRASHRPRPTAPALGLLALALALAACQVKASPSGAEARAPRAKASDAVGDRPASGGTSPAQRPAAQASGSASPRLGIPARASLPIPPSLLGAGGVGLLANDGAALIANDGTSLIANDGAALIANDGSSLLANDGGGLIANDGAGLIANDGSGLIANDGSGLRPAARRLQQSTPSDPGPGEARKAVAWRFAFQASLVKDAQAGANGNLLLYTWQALSINRLFKLMGQVRWARGQAVPLVLPVSFLGGYGEDVLLNVVPQTGPRGLPTFWCYNVGTELRAHLGRSKSPLGLRPARPTMALEVEGPGRARFVWHPEMPIEGGRTAFQTRFDLAKGQALAEVILALPKGEAERRIRWAFERREDKVWRLLSDSRMAEGKEGPEQLMNRRLAMELGQDGEARHSFQLGPERGPFRYGVGLDGSLGDALQRFGFNVQGEFLGPTEDGPDVATLMAKPPQFPGLGGFDGDRPGPVPEGDLAQIPDFAFPGEPPAPAPVVFNGAMQDLIASYEAERAQRDQALLDAAASR